MDNLVSIPRAEYDSIQAALSVYRSIFALYVPKNGSLGLQVSFANAKQRALLHGILKQELRDIDVATDFLNYKAISSDISFLNLYEEVK